MNEFELIQAFQAGDRNAAARLLTDYEKRIFVFLYRILGNQADAEDALQETLLKCVTGLQQYREEGRFITWLLRIAHREAINILRKKDNRIESFQDTAAESKFTATTSEPSSFLTQQEDAKELEQAINQLPAAEREVVWLRIKNELTFKEIAAVVDAPINTVLGRMRNAIHRLQRMMQEAKA